MLSSLNEGIFSATAPLRIPIAGGGTDLPEYYTKHKAFWMSLAINKKIQVLAHKSTEEFYLIHYKNNESCKNIDEIKHPIVRELLKYFKIDEPIIIHSVSELTGNSGLGSSSNFAICLTKVLSQMTGKYINNIPEFIFDFERNVLNEFVGKQDSYSAYCGGLNIYEANEKGEISVSSFLSSYQIHNLCKHLVLVKAGGPRLANESLKIQAHNMQNNKDFEEKYHKTKSLAYDIKDLLMKDDYKSFGYLVEEHWQNKLKTFNSSFHPEVFQVHDELMNYKCLGAKLCGAGSSGYMLGVFPSPNDVINYIKHSKNIVISVEPNFQGLI
jgi:D-glycero-alpha-D-manno-heptose-7-phosphate kinase